MTIQYVSLLPLEVCDVKQVMRWAEGGVVGRVKAWLAAAVFAVILCFVVAHAALAQAVAPATEQHTDSSAIVIGEETIVFHVPEAAALHLSGVIASQGTGMPGLEKLGGGTLMLSGQNTFLGNTLLREGTLHVAGTSALGDKLNSLLAYQGSVVSYAPGATIFNQMHLRGDNVAQEVPGGGMIAPASLSLANSIQWRVDSGTAILAGNIVGAVPIVKQGQGTLRLTGIAMFPSFFTVNEGALSVDWLLAGRVGVNHGARLEGSGTVRAVTLQDGATLSPGNGLGDTAVLTLTEKLEFKPGSVFEVDAMATGQADKAQVVGKALLDGQLVARAGAGDWQPSTRYTVLQATGGFDGTRFASAATNLAFLSPSLSYDDQHVYLSLDRNGKPLDEVTETPTEKDVADVVDENDNPGVHDEIVLMDQPQAREAFSQLSGSWTASVRSAMLDDSRFVREAVLRHIGPQACQEAWACRQAPRFWSQAFYSSADRASAGGTPADARDISGLVLGGERPVNATWRAGGFLGVQQASMQRPKAMASAHIDSWHAGLSLAGRWRDVDVAMGVAHTWSKVISQRKIAVAGLRDALSGSYRGRTLQVFGEVAAPLRWFGNALASVNANTISPFVRLAWVQASTDGFVENGGPAALNVLPARQAVWFSTLGLRARHRVETPVGVAHLQGELAWRHASGDVRSVSRQRFRDSSKQRLFVSEGLPVARQAWSLQLGVSAQLANKASLGVAYAGQFASRRQDHGVRVEVALVF